MRYLPPHEQIKQSAFLTRWRLLNIKLKASEISRPVHISRQKYLIYRKQCQHTYWEGIDLLLTGYQSYGNRISSKVQPYPYYSIVYIIWIQMKHLEKKKNCKETTQELCVLFWTKPGSSTLQNSSCTCLPSHKQFKYDELDKRANVGDVKTNS